MNYRLAEINDLDALNEMIREFHASGEKSLTPGDGFNKNAYEEWVKMIHNNAEKGTIKFGKEYVHLCFDEEKLVGLLSIRVDMPKDLLEVYGNVGYSVRPSQRRKGYGSLILKDGLIIAKEKGLKEVLLGALKDNVPSIKIILKNGGKKFKESAEYHNELTYYYRIKL